MKLGCIPNNVPQMLIAHPPLPLREAMIAFSYHNHSRVRLMEGEEHVEGT
jgi:hypothetical protein